MKQKILLDTDIGSDIDDVLCLAYLLSHPQIELLGITTVTGETKERAKLASVLCEIAGQDVPIFPGSTVPLVIEQKQKKAPQKTVLKKWKHKKRFPQGQAVEFLRKTIYAHPGEITLICIAPLTNIALLFRSDPQIPKLLKKLVIMCGVFKPSVAGLGPCDPVESNALFDPHAAAIVFGSKVKEFQVVGLDVTCPLTISKKEFEYQIRNTHFGQAILDLAKEWFKENDVVTFHDALSTVHLFHPNITNMYKGTVSVELASPRLSGMTYFTKKEDGNLSVALEIQKEKFFEKYFSILKG